MSDPFTLGVGAVAATANAFKLLQGFNDIRDATKVQSLKFELMALLLEAQTTQADLISEKRKLEERVRELEAWNGEAERYKLTDLGAGTLTYVVKPEAQGSDPFHMLCAKCVQHRRKSLLQRLPAPVAGRIAYECHECGSQVTGLSDKLREIGAIKPKPSEEA